MNTPQTDAQEAQRFFELLYPDAPADAYVVCSWPKEGQLRSQWFSPAQSAALCAPLTTQAARMDLYVGVGLRHPDCTPTPDTRGTSADVYALPGLWVEFDHNAGTHAAQNLPTLQELLALIEALPCRFSLLVDSGGGIHAYALFKELWLLDTPEEHQAAALLLRRFQRTIQATAAARGWQVDNTADLARVLRPAGTLNHKSGTPRPVTILHEDAIRYNPSAIADAPWLATIEDMYTPPTTRGDFHPPQLDPISTGCAWLRHCRDDAARLPEPEWYGMLGIVGRCAGGEHIAHEWSAPDPRYSKDETAKKLQHALADAGPRTCSTIRFDLGGEDFCRDCTHWGSIKSPMVLGRLGTGSTARGAQGGNGTRPPQHTAPPAEDDPPLGWNDYVNALHLVREHGQNLRYCWPWRAWLVWTGTHWQRDDTGAVRQRAKQTVKRLARRAEDLDDQAARALMAHVKKSLSTAAIKAMIESAQDEPGIPVQPDALDANPWVLNCQGGTLDLQSGTLRPHDPADLITKVLAVPYDPDAACPTWDAFLWRIMGGTVTPDNPDMSAGELEQRHTADARAQALISFLQRAIGYSLTGSTREQCLFILYGVTKTGKSTLLATLRALLGPYGQQADMQSFLQKDREEVRNDLADLATSRLVCALESQEGKRLAESLIKQLTGGTDPIKARFLFQEHFTYKPQFKIFLGTNHKPVIRDTDSAIWERIRLIPFAFPIPVAERDKTLDEQLQRELPGILAWAVRGCLEWQRLGELREPEAVEQATQGYRDEMDDIGRFLHEACLLQADYKTQAAVLLKAYQQWSGYTTETAKNFAAKLSVRGYESKRGNTGMFWQGIGVHAVNTEDTR